MPQDAGCHAQQEKREDGEPVRCAACGSSIDPGDWHPVAAGFDGDGEFHLVPFCSTECRQSWKEGKSAT